MTDDSIVERVVLHMVEPAPADPAESLRVFVVFSGMAGAWRSIKELDGRFFAGKKIVSWLCGHADM
jgi:splicing factor 45